MYTILSRVFYVMLLLLLSHVTFAATPAKVLCTAPTEYTDGSPISEPLTFDLYCKKGQLPFTAANIVGTSTSCEFPPSTIISGISDGVYSCAVAAYGLSRSALSKPILVVFESGGIVLTAPNAPTNVKLIPLP